MRRRDFFWLLGGGVFGVAPLLARARQTVQTIGFLSTRAAADYANFVAAFRQGLSTAGYREGENVAIEFRWAEGQYDRLPSLVTDLIARQVAVIVTAGGEPSALAAKAATSTVPIVFAVGGNPVKLGLISAVNRPGGNATGINILTATLEAKRLGLLHEIVPKASAIAVLLNPRLQNVGAQSEELETAARDLNRTIERVYASTQGELDSAFETLRRSQAKGLLVTADPFFDITRDQIIASLVLPGFTHGRGGLAPQPRPRAI